MKAKLAKRKTGFCMRMKESWKEMKLGDLSADPDFSVFYLCLWRSDADGKQVISDV